MKRTAILFKRSIKEIWRRPGIQRSGNFKLARHRFSRQDDNSISIVCTLCHPMSLIHQDILEAVIRYLIIRSFFARGAFRAICTRCPPDILQNRVFLNSKGADFLSNKTDLTMYDHLNTKKPMADAYHPPTHRRFPTSQTLHRATRFSSH